MKRLVFFSLAAAFIALVCSICFDVAFSPEKLFFQRCAQASDAWAEELRKGEEPCYVFAGGSEIRTSIDPGLLLREKGVRGINAGMAAGYGLRSNVAMALLYLRAGDTLVLSCPPSWLSGPAETTGGIKIAFMRCGFGVFKDDLLRCTMKNVRQLLSPSTPEMCMYAARRIFMPHHMYKYDEHTNVHPTGWMEVLYDEMSRTPDPKGKEPSSLAPSALPKAAWDFLQTVKTACEKRGVALVLMHPVFCLPEEEKASHAFAMLPLVKAGYRYLKDERLGVISESRRFADTDAHLNSETAGENTLVVGELLKSASYWTEEELVRYLYENGWDENGRRVNQER